MSGEPSGVREYRVECSGRVREHLAVLSRLTYARGDGNEFLAALREFERRLRIYPQFGDPLSDLREHTGQLRIGIVRPLSMRYGVFEDRRLVLVSVLPVLLTWPGPA